MQIATPRPTLCRAHPHTSPEGAEFISPGRKPWDAPRKEPSPGGATASAPAHKHNLGPITNIDINKYRYPSI